MRVGLAAAVAGARHTHQPGVQLVLHVALEHAVLDQRGALGRRAFVVDAQRTAAVGQGAVVDDGAQARRHFLANPPAVGRTALAVEIALQAVADRLVEQHAGPAGAHHHRQGAGRRRLRLEVDQRLAQRLAGVAHGAVLAEEIAVVGTPAAALAAALAAAVLLDDDADVEAHQRTDVGRQATVGGGHQDVLPAAGHAHGDLLDARIERTGGGIHALEQLDLLAAAEHFQRVVGDVQRRRGGPGEGLHAALLAGAGDRARRVRGGGQRFAVDRVAVCEAGLLAGLRAHPDALVEVEAAVLDDAVLQHPGLRDVALEIQVGGIDARPGQLAEQCRQGLDGQVAGGQQLLADG
ncbi:hypothetical protein D9M69_388560 [compost metagenome]